MFKPIVQIIAVLAIIFSLLPYLKVKHWTVRAMDFPQFQLTILTLLSLICFIFIFEWNDWKDLGISVLLIFLFILQLSRIFPYTSFANVTIHNCSNNFKNDTIKLYTVNVLQDNKRYDLLAQQLDEYDPDVLVITELSKDWEVGLKNTLECYTHRISQPLDNTYGIGLYSKYQLIEPEIKYLVDNSIPSVHSKVRLSSGEFVQLYAIHPAPPLPQHNPTSTDRDAEMMMIALSAMKSELPVIVMGDFNDVAWSETTRLFERISGLLDMRKGRGFFNTYSAKSAIMRWPLDHIFVSPHFRIISLKRGDDINSDHFPFYAELTLEPDLSNEQKRPPPKESELLRALETVRQSALEKDEIARLEEP